jgi:hypothetical protein
MGSSARSRCSSSSLRPVTMEEVVEVVRDVARELAHRFHLLRLLELVLEPLGLGDVADDVHDLDHVAGGVAHRGQ